MFDLVTFRNESGIYEFHVSNLRSFTSLQRSRNLRYSPLDCLSSTISSSGLNRGIFRYSIREKLPLDRKCSSTTHLEAGTSPRKVGVGSSRVGEWVDTITMLPKSVCCLRCNDLIVFNCRVFDARMWQRHRDSCSGINNIVMAVVRELFELVNR